MSAACGVDPLPLSSLGNVSIRGRILRGVVHHNKMKRTIVVGVSLASQHALSDRDATMLTCAGHVSTGPERLSALP